MAEFLLPSLGADMTTGTLVAWKVKPGDVVQRGQVVAEIETDKGVIDVECFEPGTVERLVAEPGQKLPVGAVLAVINRAAVATETPCTTVPPAPVGTVATAESPSVSSNRRKVTPAARKRAAELGIDLERIDASGVDGVIDLADVESSVSLAAPPSVSTQPEDSRERMRRAIAGAMSRSKREIPHYYLETKIDVSRALAWLEAENHKRSLTGRLLPAVLLLKAVARALADVPQLNGFWIDGHFQAAAGVHLGMAVAMKGGGLVAPAIHDADRKTIDELMAALNDLIPRARTGRLRSSEMTDATATLTNLGDLGVDAVFGIIYPPQVALIGLGKISPQPWVDENNLCVRPVLTVTLSADHRATDGRLGGKFLELLRRRLQCPEEL